MKKDIFIIHDYFTSGDLLLKNSNSFDILALTPIAMLSLDKINFNYKTVEDLYNINLYKTELINIYNETEIVFDKIDSICQSFVEFPYSYTGNINYFMEFLADLFFIEKLSNSIESNYNKIFLVNFPDKEKINFDHLSYSGLKTHPKSDTLAIPQSAGLSKNTNIINNCLNNEKVVNILYIKTNPNHQNHFLKKIIKIFINSNKKFLLNIFKNYKNKLSQNENIFIIQDNYEVTPIIKFLSDYNYINPTSKLRSEIESKPEVSYDFSEIKLLLEPFIKKYWPKLNQSILELFHSYHKEVVGRIDNYQNKFNYLINKYKPKLFLCSVGSRDVFDLVANFTANKRDIPVIYLQHGGATIFFNNIYQKYVETDKQTKKTLIFNSKIEADYIKHEGSKGLAFGSILRYEWLNENKIESNKNVIFCCSPFSFYRFNLFQFENTTKESYNITNDIICCINNNNLIMDIKPHPSGLNYQIDYLNQSIINKNKITVVYDSPIESMLNSYGLIIIDSLASAITALILAIDVPVILYLKDLSIINKVAEEDLMERCYIVNNYQMLDEVISKFAIGALPSKWNEKFIDNYVYPVDKGNPKFQITDYIRSIC